MQNKSQHFCWTFNNYTEADVRRLKNLVDTNKKVLYLLWGVEEAPTTGTKHLQGYIQMKIRTMGSTVKRLLGEVHLTACDGSDEDNHTYCSKCDDWFEFGERKTIPRKTKGTPGGVDFGAIIAKIREGYSLMDLATEFPAETIKYAAGLARLIKEHKMVKIIPRRIQGVWDTWEYPNEFEPDREWHKSLWLKGPAGIGKTQWALLWFENPLFVSHVDDLKLYNTDYDGIIFDDINFKHWPRESQISICDIEQPRTIHVRYGVVRIPAGTKKIFTSNVEIFDEDDAIKRRYHKINMNSF